MRKAPFARIVALALLGLAACSADQPDSIGVSKARLSFVTETTLLPIFDCYEIWREEFPYDGVPDVRASTPSRCFDTGLTVETTFPSPHATTVFLLRAGQTIPEVLASSASGGNSYLDITPFDATPPQTAPYRPPENVNGQLQYFLNGLRVSVGSFTYLALRETRLVLGENELEMVTETVVPNLFDPRPAQTDPFVPVDAAQAFEFDLAPGDTVSVSSRKAPSSFAFSPLYPPPAVRATLAVDGVPVTVRGTSATDAGEQTSLSFSYSRN